MIELAAVALTPRVLFRPFLLQFLVDALDLGEALAADPSSMLFVISSS